MSTHFSAAFMLVAIVNSKSLGMPTITSSPLFLRAFMVPSSASNSLTFWNPLSLSIRTTVSGGSGWLACVPQFAPIAPTPAAAKHSQETNTTAATAAPWPDRESMEGLFQLQIAGRFCWIALLCTKNSPSSDLGAGQIK